MLNEEQKRELGHAIVSIKGIWSTKDPLYIKIQCIISVSTTCIKRLIKQI